MSNPDADEPARSEGTVVMQPVKLKFRKDLWLCTRHLRYCNGRKKPRHNDGCKVILPYGDWHRSGHVVARRSGLVKTYRDRTNLLEGTFRG